MIWSQENIREFLKYIGSDPSENAARSNEATDHIPNSFLVYRMLQSMNDRQTAAERQMECTSEANGVGFNGSDAGLLGNIANKSSEYKNLTPNQSRLVAKKLVKYSRQLEEIAAEKAAERAAHRAAVTAA